MERAGEPCLTHWPAWQSQVSSGPERNLTNKMRAITIKIIIVIFIDFFIEGLREGGLNNYWILM